MNKNPKRIRFKTTQHILCSDFGMMRPFYDNYQHGINDLPPTYNWNAKSPLRFENVDIWEVLLERGDRIGVYAAWCPYDELYIVVDSGKVVAEFYGMFANESLEEYLINNNINYPKGIKKELKNIPAEKAYIL
jgi:hypothetical protein